MQHNKSSNGICPIALILAIASLTACGSESTAAANDAQGSAATSVHASAQPKAATQAAPAAAALPIDQGIYAQANQGCARATEILFYDGTNIGEVKTNEEWEGDGGPSSSVERIARIGPPRTTPDADFAAASRGFTLAWSAEQDGGDFPSLAVKPAGAGRFVRLRMGGNMIISYDEDIYQKCAFVQLSPQMQAAIRAEHPQLASGASTPAGAAVPAQSNVVFPPIEKGYYAIGVSCAHAIAGGGDLLAYLDERRFASFDGGQRVQGFDAMGGNRYRVRATSSDESGSAARADFVIAVQGRTSFTSAEYGDRYTHCPTVQVPRAIRQEWGDLARQ